eukprot:10583349-Karenia_brevis.AAC.1
MRVFFGSSEGFSGLIRGSFWDHPQVILGSSKVILGSSQGHFGIIWGPFRIIWGSFRDHLRIMWGPARGRFGIISGLFLEHLGVRRRVFGDVHENNLK